MLAAGFATLEYLKSRLLPEAARTDEEYDAALEKLGLALAGRMEGHCGRKFARLVGAVDEFSAWSLAAVLKRYPVETITSIQLRDSDGTLTVLGVDYSNDESCGLIDFYTTPGSRGQRLVITYTGGYWLDDGTTMPEGATALPDDLLELWLAEVQLHAASRGIFEAVGLRSGKDAGKDRLVAGLSEQATDGLRPYRRFAGE